MNVTVALEICSDCKKSLNNLVKVVVSWTWHCRHYVKCALFSAVAVWIWLNLYVDKQKDILSLESRSAPLCAFSDTVTVGSTTVVREYETQPRQAAAVAPAHAPRSEAQRRGWEDRRRGSRVYRSCRLHQWRPTAASYSLERATSATSAKVE